MKMNQLSKRQYKEAMEAAGFRERYALEHGTVHPVTINGQKCFRFTYSSNDAFQDANGAIYNTQRKAWIG